MAKISTNNLVGFSPTQVQAMLETFSQSNADGESKDITFRLDVSEHNDGTNDGLTEGAADATVVKNSTGSWTFTLTKASIRPVVFIGDMAESENFVRSAGGGGLTTGFTVLTPDDAGTEQDVDFSVTVRAFY
jgi:hypothetical protein